MWRSLLAHPKKGPLKILHYRQSSSSSSEGRRKLISIGSFVLSAGLGFTGAIAYGKYDPNFKKVLQDNIPYVKQIYNWLPSDGDGVKSIKDKLTEKKVKDTEALPSSLLKKKLDREKSSATEEKMQEVPKPPIEAKDSSSDAKYSKDDTFLSDIEVTITFEKDKEESEKEELASNENALSETLQKLRKSSTDAVRAQNTAVSAVKNHTEKLYEALDLPEGKDGDLVWKDAKLAISMKEKALNIARMKATEARILFVKLENDVKKIDPSSPLVKDAKSSMSHYAAELLQAESEVAAVESEAKSAAEYQKLVNTSKEQFRKELQIVLPNYLHDKDINMTDGDLNLLIAHAHRRIEQLQKQIAKQQVSEKLRVDEAIRSQRMQDEEVTESRIQAEMKKRHLDLESAVENRVSSLKAGFEADLHQQLLRQAAAHSDHLQEVIKVQEQELARKHILELEEKLLHQKGVFISEVSGNMARIKGILDFLKAKSEFDRSSKSSQALWLACEAMYSKIALDKVEHLSRSPPLAKDIASVKIATSENSEFIQSVLSSIPADAVQTGVFPAEVLKERFKKVKDMCRKVALVDENNDSLFRYVLSYLQSLLMIDAVSIPKGELEGKVAVDPSEWDTFDVLSRISYCLQINDMDQALRYANQLRGEPKAIARDWMKEVKLLLETQLAVKALLAHAAAVGVQAYH